MMAISFEQSYAKLPPILHRVTESVAVAAPKLAIGNDRLAEEIGLPAGWLEKPETVLLLSGSSAHQGLAMAYAGHQFGRFVPSLGDGRAYLLGDFVGPDGVRRDLHLKGAGRTVYSRGGDGRATLQAMLREFIISEAMAGLGIATTRALAVVATGEDVPRERLEPGAVLTRVARSHVRVGTFQFLAVRGEDEAMAALVDYEIARNFSNAPEGSARFIWFLAEVIRRQALLVSQWMCVGFIHGVMNTDNMSVCGETIDFGPCAFMDAFHPQKVFSSIDEHGRYAWDKQPTIALWNLTRLAEALLPLFASDRSAAIAQAEAELMKFLPAFETAFETGMMRKFGSTEARDSDGLFIAETFMAMADGAADFTNFFVALTDQAPLDDFFKNEAAHAAWLQKWQAYVPQPDYALMQKVNPRFIARNHRVEQALNAARAGDLSLVHRLAEILAKPFDLHPEWSDYAEAPQDDEIVHATFCGT